MKGKLIVIEGGDSSGKSTQLKLLSERLEKEGKKIKHMHFPKHEVSFGKVVDAYLRGEFGDKKELPPEFIAMLYITDFYETKKEIKESLEKGEIILLSRYFSSTLTYQVALAKEEEKEEMWEWIKNACSRLPQPNEVIVLYVPIEYSQKLLDNEENAEAYKKGCKRDQHESDMEFQKNFMKEYDKCINKLGWKKIECVKNGKLLTIEEIHEKLYCVVEKTIKE